MRIGCEIRGPQPKGGGQSQVGGLTRHGTPRDPESPQSNALAMSAEILLMKVGTLLFGFPRLVWVFRISRGFTLFFWFV